MKHLLSIVAGVLAACLLFCGSTVQAQTIGNVYPNGTNMFQPSSTLSFTASSAAGVTNVTVALTVSSLYTGQSFIKNLTAANGLTITGPTTGLSVSAVLTSNTLYSAVIQIKDANGNSASQTVNFDTIVPAYTWEAEDWDYTSNSVSGLYIDNPQINQYKNLLTTDNVDAHNGNGPSPYRLGGDAGGGGLATEVNGDSPKRLAYIGTTNIDYDVGWTDGNDWANWTRHYPVGTYNVFARVGGGSGAKTESADLTLGFGNAVLSSPASSPYKFGVKGLGWQSYDFMPVTDSGGNLIQITFDGNPQTLRFTQVQGGDNMQFFMLVPPAVVQASTVIITNVYPDGAFQFQATNIFSFNASSPVSINPGSDVTVNLAGTNLFGVGSVTALTTANGLIVTGNSTNINVTAPLTSNMVYTAFIQVSDANGIPASYTVTFDTIAPAYTFEAEDFNYGNGNFFDNPQTNAYNSLDGVAEVDYHRNNSGGNGGYNRIGLPGEGAGDVARLTHIGFPDYDLGNTAGGNWGNYTRTYPSGIYNIFVRSARGNGGTQIDAGKVSLVTSDRTQPNQTIQDLGKHNTPSTGGWQKYVWAPIINNGGFPARFVADGTVKTLRYTFDGAGENVGFIMLLPADLSVNPPPFVSGFTPDGTGMFQPSNSITFAVNSSVGIAQSNVVLNLNGVNVSGLSFSGSSTLWNVTYPIKTNAYYTAIITLTDSAGTTRSTNTFGTFDANNYQWEAEDYDYVNSGIPGQYFDNPQVGSYANTEGLSGTDMFESDPNGPGRGNHYRLATSTDFPDEVCGDQARAQFIAVSATDYNLGSFGINSWANYTRHYPSGTYYVIGRFAEGAGPAGANLSLLTPGVSTNLLGVFNVQNLGWGTWQWAQMVDNSGNPTKVTLDGSLQILRMGGTSGNEVNVNFLMLVATAPTPMLTATVSGGNVHISFPTQTGYTYQLQYKTNLTDASWTPLGGGLAGNGSVQTINDSAAGNSRFYRVEVQ